MKARIATVCQGGHFHNSVEENRKHIMGLLDLALRQKPDLVCLPEAFTTVSVTDTSTTELAETVPGPTTDAVAKRAKEHGCYIICPIRTKRDSKLWNSAVVIDRSGETLGIYDKVQPVTTSSDYTVFENGVTPGREIQVFNLDFGRIGIQICFDIGFPEGWEKLCQNGARMVFWPSAYNGGFPLQVYAYLHHYYVVSSVRSDKSRIIDPCGVILAETDQLVNVICRDINLDFVVSHYDFNYSIPDEIMKTYPSRVEIRTHRDDGHFLIEPIDDTLTIEQLRKEFGFEPTFQYHERHREAYRLIHQGKAPVAQRAAHRDRPQYSKED
ncbi:MAG: carbon-nitrogen hydrolase family protein [Candidatus Bathyarchaeia archaeon]